MSRAVAPSALAGAYSITSFSSTIYAISFTPTRCSNPSLKRTASQPLSSNVSPFIFRFYAGQHLFQRLAFLRAFSFGFLALCWASPACTAQVSCLFGLQRLHSKRHQLSFLQRCAASVAQRFFVGRALLQVRAFPFGLRV